MKIMVISSYIDAWNSVRPEAEMIISMAEQGHHITIVTQGNAPYVSRFRDKGLTVIDAYPHKKICCKTITIIRNELKKYQYDIVYATNSRTIPNAAFACIGFPATKLVTYRGTVGGLYRHDPSAYLTHLHPRVNGISCVADKVREDVAKQVWSNKNNVVAIHKGHDLAWYQTQAANLSFLNITANDFVIICVANARPSKGVHILLEAMQYLEKEPNIHLLLAGRGIDTAANQQLAQQAPYPNNIHFLGYRTDVPELMAAANVQIQPSVSGEGLPKTVIEAMAMAIPSIVTTTGGNAEIVKDGVSGFVVETNNAHVIADKINYIYHHATEAKIMGLKAQHYIATTLSVENTAQQHLAFFERLLKQ
ncbi:glycosyltransferase family 4 protein [Photobacterium carnosum]|uniref:Glycosyl transferase family 1 n=1 Tax=Photobacterium carnosum TaxID=2023717 RepID=A0A2N4UUJ2_9GAMM|nr:glycosyltransferase family 4 protein [Photobacterium carnosum]MCD9537584.1 glycosyltransferase [Photobacterium carnosum]MCF2162130.1 glycosyltransferase [Photobacterium carnosum]PLC58684.1 glycosyl transferase family 1 [Photobacterium carnosum]